MFPHATEIKKYKLLLNLYYFEKYFVIQKLICQIYMEKNL